MGPLGFWMPLRHNLIWYSWAVSNIFLDIKKDDVFALPSSIRDTLNEGYNMPELFPNTNNALVSVG